MIDDEFAWLFVFAAPLAALHQDTGTRFLFVAPSSGLRLSVPVSSLRHYHPKRRKAKPWRRLQQSKIHVGDRGFLAVADLRGRSRLAPLGLGGDAGFVDDRAAARSPAAS
jgi:hypothetical protein